MSDAVLVNLHIQNHSEHINLGVINMSYDILLGVDWLQKHNPLIDWESNQLTLSCCGTNLVQSRSGDAQPLNPVVSFESRNSLSSSATPGSLHVAMISAEDLFNSDHISAFGFIQLKPDSCSIALSDSTSDSPVSDIKSKVPEKYHGFINVFVDKEASTLPPHWDHDLKIELEEGKILPFRPIYSLTLAEKEALRSYISDNLAKGFIHPSTSSAASPILFVKKSNGSLCLCVNYRGLNAITKQNHYPLPLVNELLNAVHGCHVFSKLDLKSTFNLLQIAPGDEWKTAFHTNEGLFEYLVMPFRLTNALAAFQSFIQWVLQEFLDITCIVYLDDILVFSHTQEEHDLHVLQIL